MKYNFDIVITTFSLRFHFLQNLLKQISELNIETNIIICINGEKDGKFDLEYRDKILKLCDDYVDVYPIFFIERRGLSKMWNTGIIHSVKNDVLILNDDISINSSNIFDIVNNHIQSNEYTGLSIINNTFSFFVVNKKTIDDLGYFDERLLGFGEEDGDISYRFKEKYKRNIFRLYANNIDNIISDIAYPDIKKGIGKYSWFNRNFMFQEKYSCNGDIYYFPDNIECDKKLQDIKLYPYESYFWNNKDRLE